MKDRITEMKDELAKRLRAGDAKQTYRLASRFLRAVATRDGDKSRDAAMAHRCMALCLSRMNRLAQAEKELLKALAIAESGGCPPDSIDVSFYMANLAVVRHYRGHHKTVDDLFLKAGMIAKACVSPDHAVITNLLEACADSGVESVTAFGKASRAIWLAEAMYGSGYLSCVALEKLNEEYSAKGAADESSLLLARLADRYASIFGQHSCLHGDTSVRVVATLDVVGQPASRELAERCWRDALAAQKLLYVPDNERVIECLDGLARIAALSGDSKETEAQLLELLPLVRRHGARTARLPDVLSRLAEIHLDSCEYGRAAAEQREAVELTGKSGKDEEVMADRLLVLGTILRAWSRQSPERRSQALEACRLSLRFAEKAFGPGNLHVADALEEVASLDGDMGRYRESIAKYRRSLAIRRKAQGSQSPEVAETLNDMAAQHLSLGGYREMRALLAQSLRIMRLEGDMDRLRMVPMVNNMGIAQVAMGKINEGILAFEDALRTVEEARGTQSPRLLVHQQNLAGAVALAGQQSEAERLYVRAIRIAKDNDCGGRLKVLESELSAVRAGTFRKPVERFWYMEAGSAA